jgi:AcrR family transcriptional regulator
MRLIQYVKMTRVLSERTRVRERRSPQYRRRQILDAAVPLFAGQGFEETGVGDVAEAASVAIGTVYLYFPSKEHLLDAIHEEFHRGLETSVQHEIEGFGERMGFGGELELATAIDVCLDAMAAYVSEHRNECQVIARYVPRLDTPGVTSENARAFAVFARILKNGCRSGMIQTTDPEMTALLLGHAIERAIGGCVVQDDPKRLERVVTQAKELFRKALAPR